MGIVNAVLVYSGTKPRWVEDAASIATWGRIEDDMSVGTIEDPATIDAIGAAWLAPRAQPLISHTTNTINTAGATAGDDYADGDTLTAPDGTARVMELGFSMNPQGGFDPTAGLNSPLEEELRRTDAKVQRMIAAAGGASPVSSPPSSTGSNIVAGKRQPRVVDRWSWRYLEDLDPEFYDPDDEDTIKPWQPATLEEPTVITSIVIDCDFDEADDDSIFVYMVNGVAPLTIPALGSIPTTITVPVGEGHAEVPMYGHNWLSRNDRPSIVCIVNGGHTNGSVTMNGADPE